jgi:hypothetical protein
MKNYSQAHQDLFVLECLDMKPGGRFLDLGCNEPVLISNTYLLETQFKWDGLCIDVDPGCIKRHKETRKSKSVLKDCTRLVQSDLDLSHYDYLSLDLEPASVTLSCLKNLLQIDVEFSVITYEHDEYRFGKSIKEESRRILQDSGYTLVCRDVHNQQKIYNFEDWYVNYKYIDPSSVEHLICEGLISTEIATRFKKATV